MIKNIAMSAVVAATLFGAAMLPAHASLSQSDCAFAQRQLDQGLGPSSGGSYNPYRAALNGCSVQN